MTTGGASTIPATRFAERMVAAREATQDRGAAALLIGVGPQLRWLTGYAAVALERLTMLVLPAEGPATLVVPRLERMPAATSPAGADGLVEIATWDETDDPTELVATALAARRGGRLLLSDHLWAIHTLRLQARLSDATFGLATEAMAELRAIKDADEIERLRAAGSAADRVVAGHRRGPPSRTQRG